MRALVILVCLLFIGIWTFWLAYLIGYIQPEWLPEFVKPFVLPKTTAELGESFGMLSGFFSSLVVAFAFITIVHQGKELRNSIKTQKEQSQALIVQLQHQETSNRITALSTRLAYLISEIERMDKILNEVKGDKEKSNLFYNCSDKKKKFIHEAENIDQEIKSLLV